MSCVTLKKSLYFPESCFQNGNINMYFVMIHKAVNKSRESILSLKNSFIILSAYENNMIIIKIKMAADTGSALYTSTSR